MTPAIVTPDLEIIPLDVDGDIPYLAAGGLASQGLSATEIAAYTGVTVSEDGKLVISPDYLGRYFDAARHTQGGHYRPCA